MKIWVAPGAIKFLERSFAHDVAAICIYKHSDHDHFVYKKYLSKKKIYTFAWDFSFPWKQLFILFKWNNLDVFSLILSAGAEKCY